MTSELSNLQMVAPCPYTEIDTGANGKGLPIAHIGKSNHHNKSYIFRLNSVRHVA